jgi:hypothetical protein
MLSESLLDLHVLEGLSKEKSYSEEYMSLFT